VDAAVPAAAAAAAAVEAPLLFNGRYAFRPLTLVEPFLSSLSDCCDGVRRPRRSSHCDDSGMTGRSAAVGCGVRLVHAASFASCRGGGGGGAGLCSEENGDGDGNGGGGGGGVGVDDDDTGAGRDCSCSDDGPPKRERPVLAGGGDVTDTGPPILNAPAADRGASVTGAGGRAAVSSASESACDHRRHDRILGLFCNNRLQL